MSLNMNEFQPTEADVQASLAPPEAAREFVNPVEDDTWLRHADLVRLEQLRSVSDEDVDAKRALMREYATSTQPTADSRVPVTAASADATMNSSEAAIVEGMEWQEKFLDEYKRQNASEDKNKALTYKQKMMENFRKKHGGAVAAPREEGTL